MGSGNPNIKNDSAKGYDAELLAEEILESQGFEVLYNPERMKRILEKGRNSMNPRIQKSWEVASRRLKQARKGSNKSELEIATKEFYEIDKLHHKELQTCNEEKHNIVKKKELVKSIIGNTIMPEINRKEWEKVLGHSIEGNLFPLSFVDLFCKKDGDYYAFEIKRKTFKENTNLNGFSVTNYEVLNYDRLSKEKKIKVRVMILLEKDDKMFYRIFDWTQFSVPSKFDPHTKIRTSIRLKGGFDINELIAL